MIGNIQLLRAYAALCVVVYHCGVTFGLEHGTDFGGVAIFFVISGFLMCNFTHHTPAQFMLRRMVRIVPLYWASTLLLVFMFGGFAWYSVADVALSMFFIPHTSDQGSWMPTLGVGWTLVMEMYFYAIFAACIALAGTRAPFLASATIIAIYGLMWMVENGGVLTIYLGSNYVLFFVLGIVVFYTMRHLPEWVLSGQLPRSSVALVLTMSALAAWATAYAGWFGYTNFVIATGTVLAALLLARSGRDVSNPIAMALGNASYAIYLLHTIALEYLRQKGFPLTDSPQYVPLFLIVISAISWLVWWGFERPVNNLLRRVTPVLTGRAAASVG